MDILHVLHPFIPGQGYQENYLPQKQAQLGHDVTIVTSDVVPAKFAEQVDGSTFDPGEYEHDGVRVERRPSLSVHDAATYGRGIERAIRDRNPDVVHSHRLISLHTVQSLLGTMRSDSKLFFDAHIDNDNFHLDSLAKSVAFGLCKNTVIPAARRRADAILAVNPYCERFLREQCGIPADEIRLLPLGADTDQFYVSDTARRATREELGYDDEETVYVFAGNVSPTKDVENLLRAFSAVDLENRRLLILGEGDAEYMDRLRRLARDLNVQDRVRFHDFVPHAELYRYYNAADVGVWPGKLGITIIEGLACGLPVVLPDSPATEFLLDGNGLSYSRGNVSELSDCMAHYGSDEDARAEAAAASERLVRETLSWEQIARQSIEIYREA